MDVLNIPLYVLFKKKNYMAKNLLKLTYIN